MSEANEPVFPILDREWHRDSETYMYSLVGGLTKRELFAAMAMQGLLANSNYESWHARQATALEAMYCANALIDALAKEPQ